MQFFHFFKQKLTIYSLLGLVFWTVWI